MATIASNTLRSPGSSAEKKAIAGSALRQARTPAQTGAKVEGTASRALDNPRASRVTQTLAGSVVAQSNRKR
ncbi:hypothetical protein [Ramlibacter sp. WS9]|uniref:hypothetical protein n=1 Tax=Ramlibacter sp. WS9 TaxID=1882741 RepID=UPI001E28596C|nr:hypothetical protein [Ramlibacter sp. WS9]